MDSSEYSLLKEETVKEEPASSSEERSIGKRSDPAGGEPPTTGVCFGCRDPRESIFSPD